MDSILSAYAAFNNQSAQYQNILKSLSTGKRINSASDDPSGYVRSKLLEKETRTLQTQSRVAEREIASAQTVSSRYDQAANIIADIDSLYAGLSDISTDAEKQAVQNEVNDLTGFLDSLLSQNEGLDPAGGENLSSADLGLDSVSTDDIGAARNSVSNAYSTMLSQNASTGSHIRSQQVQQEVNQVNYVNTMAQKSTIEDADFIEGAINAQAASIRMQASLNMFKNANQLTANQFNTLF